MDDTAYVRYCSAQAAKALACAKVAALDYRNTVAFRHGMYANAAQVLMGVGPYTLEDFVSAVEREQATRKEVAEHCKRLGLWWGMRASARARLEADA